MVAPPSEAGHDLAAEPAEGGAPWGGAWGGFKDEAAKGEDGAVGMAEPDQDEGLENVDFAAITGKAAPGSGPVSPGDAVAVEPPKKKKRKREASMLGRFIGMGIAGLLAVACVLGYASWKGMKVLPSWLEFNFNKASTRVDPPKPGVQPAPPAGGQTPDANTTNPPANPKGPEAGKQAGGTAVGNTTPGPSPNQPVVPDAGKGSELAMNIPPKEGTKPAASPTDNTGSEPIPLNVNPDAKGPIEPDLPAPDKPEMAAKPGADPFGPVLRRRLLP